MLMQDEECNNRQTLNCKQDIGKNWSVMMGFRCADIQNGLCHPKRRGKKEDIDRVKNECGDTKWQPRPISESC